jgi:soluble lytic murein transglycosylase-like protein
MRTGRPQPKFWHSCEAFAIVTAMSMHTFCNLLARRPTRFTLALSALLLTVAAAAPAHADIYRYEQPDGTVVFTTKPQAGQAPTTVYGNPRAATRTGAQPRRSSAASGAESRAPGRYDAYIREAAARFQMPVAFIKAVIQIESGFNPNAVSPVGAQGLMQLMPGTATEMQCPDPFDPRENIIAGTKLLRLLSNRYNGDINLVLAAYNAGPGNVAKVGGIPFEQTRVYVENVYAAYQRFLTAERQP